MTSLADWIEGARLRTLPAAVAPVAAGTAIAVGEGRASATRALLAAGVALALQIGVNYANDYSDGIRGTDDIRSGPARLTGGGLASPKHVKVAAFACFGLGALAGLLLVALSGQWWLLCLGALAIIAAWYYTGGDHPYGYMGLGEIFVFVFFGLVATVGTTYTQTGTAPWESWVAACAIGSLACSLLMVNNIRDIPTDSVVGKKTLAVRMGDTPARVSFSAMLFAAPALTLAFIHTLGWWIVLVIAPVVALCILTTRPVISGATGRNLIHSLKLAGLTELAYGVLLLLAYAVAHR